MYFLRYILKITTFADKYFEDRERKKKNQRAKPSKGMTIKLSPHTLYFYTAVIDTNVHERGVNAHIQLFREWHHL